MVYGQAFPRHAVAASIMLLVALPNLSKADEGQVALESVVEQMPRGLAGISLQWFEMETAIGWEKMMLVFGYADNKSVCEHLRRIS